MSTIATAGTVSDTVNSNQIYDTLEKLNTRLENATSRLEQRLATILCGANTKEQSLNSKVEAPEENNLFVKINHRRADIEDSLEDLETLIERIEL